MIEHGSLDWDNASRVILENAYYWQVILAVWSDDNPCSGSIFRTLKYRSEYPEKAFGDIGKARNWVSGFVQWYNHEHRHSGIKFTTPQERHTGKDIDVLTKRKVVYKKAKLANPGRWSGRINN